MTESEPEVDRDPVESLRWIAGSSGTDITVWKQDVIDVLAQLDAEVRARKAAEERGMAYADGRAWRDELIAELRGRLEAADRLAEAVKNTRPRTVGYLRDRHQPGGQMLPEEERALMLALLAYGERKPSSEEADDAQG